MKKNEELLNLESLIFGYWQNDDNSYYFGHIPDNALAGIVEISNKKGIQSKSEYSIVQYAHGLELHISNFEYTLLKLDEHEMHLIGPLPAGVHLKFKKLPNKISYNM